jgi:peptidoglycan hydrolase-like protein with peptidoglycan-binding domain
MRVLQQGLQGSDVRKWQLFLIGQKLNAAPADGDFGPRTHRATLEFQTRHGLVSDGIVGLKTLGAAMKLGFEAISLGPSKPAPQQNPHAGDPNWPPRPSFEPLLTNTQRSNLWGTFRFEPAPIEGNRENIRILGSWESDNIVRVEIPQLRGISGAPASTSIRFHKRAADQVRDLWRAWEKAGLLDLVLTWDGSFTPRFVRGSTSVLSNHSFGTAFDINAAWNALGSRPPLVEQRGSVRELVQIANKYGFFWGGHFRDRADGMHFEVARDL